MSKNRTTFNFRSRRGQLVSSRRLGSIAGKQLTIAVLKLLVAGTILLVDLGTRDSGVRRLLRELSKADSSAERIRVVRKLREMARTGLLAKTSKGYVAGRKGKELLNEEEIWALTIPKQEKWDGRWRMVLYDIPIRKRRQRNALRMRLQEMGMVMYQASVWVYPYPLEKPVNAIAEFYGVSDCVLFAIAERLNGEKHLRTHFDL